ncbi:MAG TPA: ankyrin repeat domain-containing protein [Polaromonas sp.]|uniref:ankyrin repeat domain-containing protein n=1 Tax=Polaromonas sp. TaxID=1869339 RepID=UPI002D5737FC|nr:ankyrin repeat domain-containing protein [Polaromonas sp.]HYW57294.1 ankyrin repeat domain-containing protein [Polaromonas sp.]
MKNIFINYFRKAAYLFVLTGFISVSAGSYEDFFEYIKRDNGSGISQLLARGFDPNTLNPDGQHGLYLALQEPSLKAAQVLADWPKTDVNKLNAKGESALMIAALRGHQDIVVKLVKKDADVNKTGWTPLHYAASSGHIEIMSFLLENHAYIDAESPNKTTPLMMAAQYSNAAAVKFLLEAGADATLKNQQGLTAIQFAQRASRTDSIELITGYVRRSRSTGKW